MKRGFTLIELLVVIAIIGVLSSVVLASLNSARAKSRDARRVSDMRQIQTALELYYDSNQRYPIVKDSTGQTAGTGWTLACNSYEYNVAQPDADCWYGSHAESLATQLTPYMSTLPLSPNNGASFSGCAGNGRISVYEYAMASDGSNYKIYAFLEKSPCLSAAGNDGGNRPEAYEIFSPGGVTFD